MDTVSGHSLMYMSLTYGTNTIFGYNGVEIESWGPWLVSNYQSTTTTFTIVVFAGYVRITASSSTWTDSITVPINVNTFGRQYYL